MLVPALVVSCITVFFALRLAIGYSRTVSAMKRLKEEEAAQVPTIVREALSSRWASSWQSPVFHEIAIGDIGWAAKLPIRPALATIRRDFRWMMAGIAGAIVVISIQLFVRR